MTCQTTTAAISIEFVNIAGSSCGALLPTGSVKDVVDGVEATCVDNGMPVIVLRAADLGKTGQETPAELEADPVLRERVERIRLALGPRMGLGDVSAKTVPKMTLLARAPDERGDLDAVDLREGFDVLDAERTGAGETDLHGSASLRASAAGSRG